MNESMIERVAKALCKSDVTEFGALEWSASSERVRAIYQSRARAAIQAMREPTEAIAEIMGQRAAQGISGWRDLHEALVQAALSEPPPPRLEGGTKEGWSFR